MRATHRIDYGEEGEDDNNFSDFIQLENVIIIVSLSLRFSVEFTYTHTGGGNRKALYHCTYRCGGHFVQGQFLAPKMWVGAWEGSHLAETLL